MIKQAFKRIFRQRESYKIKPHCMHDWHAAEKAKQEKEKGEHWEYARRLARGE